MKIMRVPVCALYLSAMTNRANLLLQETKLYSWSNTLTFFCSEIEARIS